MLTHLFWARGLLSQIERLCLASFVRQRFTPLLWTYGGQDSAHRGEIGPSLLSGIVNMHPHHGFAIHPPAFANPVQWWRCPAELLKPTPMPPEAAFLHLYNDTWRRAGIDKNAAFPPGSLLAQLATHQQEP